MSNIQNNKNFEKYNNNKLFKKIKKMVRHKKTPIKNYKANIIGGNATKRKYNYIKKLVSQYYDNDVISDEFLEKANKRIHIFPHQNRIIVIGDLHGDLDMAITCLIKAKCIENIELPEIRTVDNMDIFFNKLKWIGKDTFIVQLGDQIDRVRPQNWNINDITNDKAYKDEGSTLEILYLFHYLDKLARNENGRVLSIIGNHEIMNCEGDFRYVSLEEFRSFKDHLKNVYHKKSKYPYHSRTLKNNQHKIYKNTKKNKFNYNNFKNDNFQNDNMPIGYRERLFAFSPTGLCANIIGMNNYSMLQIGNWLFCHGSPILNIIKKYKIDIINNVVSMYFLGIDSNSSRIEEHFDNIALSHSKDNIFWNRKFGEEIKNNENELCKYLEQVLEEYNKNNNTVIPATHIAIGHTPQFYNDKGINSICNGKVWRCDVGMSKAFGKNENDNNRKPQILEINNNNGVKIIEVID